MQDFLFCIKLCRAYSFIIVIYSKRKLNENLLVKIKLLFYTHSLVYFFSYFTFDFPFLSFFCFTNNNTGINYNYCMPLSIFPILFRCRFNSRFFFKFSVCFNVVFLHVETYAIVHLKLTRKLNFYK